MSEETSYTCVARGMVDASANLTTSEYSGLNEMHGGL